MFFLYNKLYLGFTGQCLFCHPRFWWWANSITHFTPAKATSCRTFVYPHFILWVSVHFFWLDVSLFCERFAAFWRKVGEMDPVTTGQEEPGASEELSDEDSSSETTSYLQNTLFLECLKSSFAPYCCFFFYFYINVYQAQHVSSNFSRKFSL